MPIYRVQTPDGSVIRVEAPEGATQEQVLAYAQQNYQSDQQAGSHFGGATTGSGEVRPPQQNYSRSRHFDEVIAPGMGDPAKVTEARAQFDEETARLTQKQISADFANLASRAQSIQQSRPNFSEARGNWSRQVPDPSQVVWDAAPQPATRTQKLSEVTGRRPTQKLSQVRAAQGAPSYSEEDVIAALRKADAAGNVDDARALAAEVMRMRGQQGSQPAAEAAPQYFEDSRGTRHQFPADATPEEIDEATRSLDPSPPPGFGEQAEGQPIQIEFPDGQLAEFPAGTSREVMQQAARRYWDEQQGQTAPAGQVKPWERYQQNAPAAGPWAKYQQADKPSFGNVRSQSRSTEQARPDFSNVQGGSRGNAGAAYRGPMLAPSSMSGQSTGPTLEEINARNRAYRGSAQQAEDRSRYEVGQRQAKQQAFRELPAAARFAVGAGARVAAAGRGAGQLYAQAADYVAPRRTGLSDLITGQSKSRYEEAMAREAQARADDAFMQGDTAAMLGGVAGDVGLLAAPGGALMKLAGTSRKAALAANVGLGAGYSGLQPITEGESRTRNAAIGGGFGAAGHTLAAGVSALGRRAAQAVPSDIQHMAQRAQAMGIPLTAGQVSQSLPVKVVASAGKYLPFSGYAKAATRQQEGTNRAVAKTFGADAPKLTDDVMHGARKDLSRQFEDIYERNAIPITEKGARKLAGIERQASRRLTNDEGQVLRNQLDDILANADDGVLTGQKYQAVRTELKKAEGNDKLGSAVKELRQALDDIAADAVGPQDAAVLKAVRSQWANMRTTENALKQNAGAGGDIRLAALWPLIRKGSTKEMRELARMGQTLLKDPIADSGTAQRTFAYNLLMGGGSLANPALIPLIAKAAIGGATVGRAANSNTLARLLARPNRGKATSGLGALLEGATPYTAPAAGAEYNRRPR